MSCAYDDGQTEHVLHFSAPMNSDGIEIVNDWDAMGFHEINGEASQSTLYNSYAVIGPDGKILNVHRKLIPTNPERMVWGWGDARGLNDVDTPAGRIGTLICWENYMPLSRYALYAQGVEVYLATTWDCGESWLGTLRHIAREAGCWVAGCSTAILYSENDLDAVVDGRSSMDIGGHYSRPDIFELTVNKNEMNLINYRFFSKTKLCQITSSRRPSSWSS